MAWHVEQAARALLKMNCPRPTSPSFSTASSSSMCAFCFAASTFNDATNCSPSRCTDEGYFARIGFKISARNAAAPYDCRNASINFKPNSSLDPCAKGGRNLINSIDPLCFNMSTRMNNCSWVNFALAKICAALLRMAGTLFGSTDVVKNRCSSKSTEVNPRGNAASASRRKSAGCFESCPRRSNAGEKLGAVVLTCDQARAAATAACNNGGSLAVRRVLMAPARAAGTSLNDVCPMDSRTNWRARPELVEPDKISANNF